MASSFLYMLELFFFFFFFFLNTNGILGIFCELKVISLNVTYPKAQPYLPGSQGHKPLAYTRTYCTARWAEVTAFMKTNPSCLQPTWNSNPGHLITPYSSIISYQKYFLSTFASLLTTVYTIKSYFFLSFPSLSSFLFPLFSFVSFSFLSLPVKPVIPDKNTGILVYIPSYWVPYPFW